MSEQLLRDALAATAAGQLDELDRYFALDVVDHDPGEDQSKGLAGIKEAAREFLAAFSEVEYSLTQSVAAGDRAAARWTIRAKHTGRFQGIPATGRAVTFTGMDLIRADGGKIVERWSNADELGLLQQLVDRRTKEQGAPAERDRRRR